MSYKDDLHTVSYISLLPGCERHAQWALDALLKLALQDWHHHNCRRLPDPLDLLDQLELEIRNQLREECL